MSSSQETLTKSSFPHFKDEKTAQKNHVLSFQSISNRIRIRSQVSFPGRVTTDGLWDVALSGLKPRNSQATRTSWSPYPWTHDLLAVFSFGEGL